MSNPWFRMYAEFATDPKTQMLSESDQRRLLMLFCFRCNEHVTLQDEEVTFLLRISKESWNITKSIFIEKGFINADNKIRNWDKRQFTSDTSKNRVAEFRKREKEKKTVNYSDEKKCNVTETLQKQKSNAIDTDTDTDTEQNKRKKAVAVAPSLSISNKSKKQKAETETDLLAAAGIDSQLAKDFLKVRKAKKAPLTKTALDGILREANRVEITLTDALTICIEKSWAGFNAEWLQEKSPGAATNSKQGYAKQPQQRPMYIYQGKLGTIDSTSEILS